MPDCDECGWTSTARADKPQVARDDAAIKRPIGPQVVRAFCLMFRANRMLVPAVPFDTDVTAGRACR
jgi:hypothetical protein